MKALGGLVVVVALAAAAAGCGGGSDDPLTVYSGREEELVAPLLAQFTEETGIDVEVRYGDSAELAATIAEEGENSPADVFFAQDPGSLGSVDAQLAELPAETLERIDPQFRDADGRWVGTSGRSRVIAYNTDELSEDGLVLRYRVDEAADDGLAGEEGTFTICSFWLVSALVEIGELERGRALCEKLLSYASPLGLYAEEIDPRSGRHLGNFPQAFTHLALINAVMHVIRADQGLEAGPLPLDRELTRQRSQQT